MRIRVYTYPVMVLETPQRWELYRVLSEPVRLRLLALVAEEELAVGEIAELLGESQPNVSRHVAPLKQLGLVVLRRQGTRSFVSLKDASDPVVADALRSGKALCESDGSLARLSEVLRARDAVAREYFDRPRGRDTNGPPAELGAYLAALAPLLASRSLVVDAGTGDGSMLDVLAPVFERVVAIDRSEAQLSMARARLKSRGFQNVDLVRGELDSKEVLRACAGKADAVFAVRLLHHAPRPGDVVKKLAQLCRPGGALIVLDYARHDDERMREQADLWLGFEAGELERLATSAGFHDARVTPIPPAFHHAGPDSHLPWQLLTARKPAAHGTKSQ
jgi:ArsR family transcriptional regulator